jgi:hypothetical protein
MKTILAVVARIIPTRVIHTPTQKYMTVEQARAELREAGIPDSVIGYTPTMDRKSPYDDPEADDAEMNDVAPNKAHLRPLRFPKQRARPMSPTPSTPVGRLIVPAS